MLDKVIYFSIKNKLAIGILTLLLVVWGSYSLVQLPIDAVPDITNNQVQIITSAPSQSALDIERLVTFPIEQTMATIPEIEEMRSFSRFGLSVVTIVFKEHVDVYWARQQVNERLAIALTQIPKGIGTPEMAPVTTGLGEIYQYIVRPEKGFEQKYNAMQLRSFQDWIVRRQLLGIPGVADVASFGGYLKQYEVALNPDRLRSYNLSIKDVFTALEKNNQNTGGAYIDKKPAAWFIRSEGLIKSIDDIANIVVTNTTDGVPILIRNIGDVKLGSATRYGAMTYNAEGDVVGAVVMMLKGENSNAVVMRVKERVEQIKKTLPEGVTIDAFLDRSELVDRAIGTVEKNLIEGALIVILVLVLFLGNLRAGLIVASVIPLAMLFAVSMMHLFGVSGNLMSLGAIDFGLIVDGAVIIVEATMHHLGLRTITSRLRQDEMDQEVYTSASKIRTSAAFGELIILIVYLPILALVGVEGKMFKPMAQAVSFAILGAFILSLTYVPMMSALFLSKQTERKRNLSDKMMDFFNRLYTPMIKRALRAKLLVIISSILLLIASLFAFLRMGGEFLPTLEEGDFAVETRVLTGSSLSYTVEASSKAAAVLLREFPDEIEEIVGKIGSSEIPTDPMPIEACDLIINLTPKNKWTKARDREALAEKMTEALEVIPGVTFGFQQPIQMRFNELMSGIRQDVAVKIFGEDLNVLTDLSQRVAKVVRKVSGTRDLYVEEVTGLPQIVVDINREEVAKYGLNIEDINQVINASFAGQSAGLVFENDQRYDLVVRLTDENRKSIDDVRNIFVMTPKGEQVPLKQLADIEFKIGPNQIQREDAKRRIIVGFNVRGRDVASVVRDIEEMIEKEVDFPPGYYPVFGGQFENLEAAQARLSFAVPMALALILVLLFFTFQSMKQALLIFTAIPMAAIGGVFALIVRGMPFSISAGVGFVALFGVAVLNGIVLIAQFNRLKEEGITDMDDIILKGTHARLRPVLMTAAVASLGFLPMAIATSAGAEVQKPLATVVIGGLISATILTLFVLPCLYVYVERIKVLVPNKTLVILFVFGSFACSYGQTVSVGEAVATALKNNPRIKAETNRVEAQQQLRKSSVDLPKTEVIYMRGQYNSYAKDDNNFSVTQSIPFTVFGGQRSLNRANEKSARLQKKNTENELVYQVKQVYYELYYLKSRRKLLIQQDSLFEGFYKSASLRFKTGETNILEQTTADAQRSESKNAIFQIDADIHVMREHLKAMMNTQELPDINVDTFDVINRATSVDSLNEDANSMLALSRQDVVIAIAEKKLASAKFAPDLLAGFFSQTLIGSVHPTSGELATRSDRFTGFQIGVAIPLWFVPHQARLKAAKYSTVAAQHDYEYKRLEVNAIFQQTLREYEKHKTSLAYYQSAGLPNAQQIITQSKVAFSQGEVSYAEYLFGVRSAVTIQEQYLKTLNDMNQTIIYLEFLSGNK
ncbi:CusA/CzcA family heavy metal efflux RND transporter [Pseudochryseolinea flava]|uniref:CusA/CzcA family heavy metal efflux RND transporter n=1 Tax=Pseudochryseolinea flava TaxID=2059302 RepID=A0A364XU89_9BACT|nr:CusA/CzcA family heavy metal efflux RND transporter [Pseudochryseolinea flava]RAV97879.1 CusA/CzcA family heavy metal efflux RND transporter [Pseudochryseolinea flava]